MKPNKRDLHADRQFIRFESSAESQYIDRAQVGWLEAVERAIAAEREVERQTKEIEILRSVLEQVDEVMDEIPKGGSKESHPYYVTMVGNDKIARLRKAVEELRRDTQQ